MGRERFICLNTWAYDPADNRTARTANAVTTTYTANNLNQETETTETPPGTTTLRTCDAAGPMFTLESD